MKVARLVVFGLALAVSLVVMAVKADIVPDLKAEPSLSRYLNRLMGSSDPGLMENTARVSGEGQLLEAIYGEKDAKRLIAIVIAGQAESPWTVLPYLAALMGSENRQVATRATASLFNVLRKMADDFDAPAEIIAPQIEHLETILSDIALRDVLAVDIRVSAIKAIGILEEIAASGYKPSDRILTDPEWEVRIAALSLIKLPIDDQSLRKVLNTAQDDTNGLVRGFAAGLLCENALSHSVEAPSKDLEKVLTAVIRKSRSGEEIATVLGCLNRFDPSARADLTSVAVSHGDPSVKELWKQLTGNSEGY